MFHGCDNLTKIEIPDSVTSIGERAFSFCNGLTSIDIPASVTSIGEEAFVYCDNLLSINVNENNNYYYSIEGVLVEKNTNKITMISRFPTFPTILLY